MQANLARLETVGNLETQEPQDPTERPDDKVLPASLDLTGSAVRTGSPETRASAVCLEARDLWDRVEDLDLKALPASAEGLGFPDDPETKERGDRQDHPDPLPRGESRVSLDPEVQMDLPDPEDRRVNPAETERMVRTESPERLVCPERGEPEDRMVRVRDVLFFF